MVNAPDLSLRGPNGAVAISGRQLRFRRGLPVIQLCTARLPRRFAPRNDTSGSAAVHQRPPAVEWLCTRRSVTALQAGNACSANSLTQHPQVCHCEERSDVGISRSGLRFRRGLYVIRPCTARLPRRFAPRNDTSGSAVVYQRPPTVELPCTGRSLSAATVKFDSDCVRRHSVYIGSAFPRLPRRFAPRNDNSGVHTIFTIACIGL